MPCHCCCLFGIVCCQRISKLLTLKHSGEIKLPTKLFELCPAVLLLPGYINLVSEVGSPIIYILVEFIGNSSGEEDPGPGAEGVIAAVRCLQSGCV